MKLARRRPWRASWRKTRFYPVSGSPDTPFRVMGLALRLLRLGAGRKELEMATALGSHPGTIEPIERGCIVPLTTDIERWMEVCGAGDREFLLVGRAAEALWPRKLPFLQLPQFWGVGAPTVAEFRTARHLIERMRHGGGLAAESDAAAVTDPEQWLADFFAPLDECESSEENREPRTATDGEAEGDPPPPSWRANPVLRFNRFVAAQGPLGVAYLPIEEPVQ